MQRNDGKVSYEDFSQCYDREIGSRTFVEDKEYYALSKRRFWEAVRRIDALDLPRGARVLDIGGGILSVLLSKLLGFHAMVADVNDRSKRDVEDLGLEFVLLDLNADDPPPVTGLDLVVLTEVIEHIPRPPYITFGKLARMIAPGGHLFLTTPNGHRFRNVVYMLLGREILGVYRYPEPGMALGHQHEYTLKQLLWQAGHAGLEVMSAEYYEDGFRGASPVARIGRLLSWPVRAVPHLRNSIVMDLRVSRAP